MRNLQIYKTRAFVARQGENRGVHVGLYMPLAELLVEALHGALRCVVVLAEVAQHDVLDPGMVHLGKESGRLDVAQMSERPGDPLF